MTHGPDSIALLYPGRADRWRLKTRWLELPLCPLLMGIVNVTPDSFSDGGRFDSVRAAVDHALRLASEGASILDIGGESTRPYAEPVTVQEELKRVLPVIRALSEKTDVPLSVDTSKAEVAREALAAGAEIINDVTGLAGDPKMLAVALESGAAACVMHTQGTPQTMQDNPVYGDVTVEVRDWLAARLDALQRTGLDPLSVALDPGIGFGKTHQHNLTLLAACHELQALRCPLVLGPSRKGFIAKVLQDKQTDRKAGTIGVCLSLAHQGVQILRVHDVHPIWQALQLFAATGGLDGKPLQLD